jgi:hypothetical protein
MKCTVSDVLRKYLERSGKMSFKKISLVLILILLCGACSGAGETEPTPDFDATLEVALQQTIAAQPTPTQKPAEESAITPSLTPAAEKKVYRLTIRPNGWQDFLFEDLGFLISLPPDWSHLDLFADDFDEILEVSADLNPQFEGLFTSDYLQSLAASGIKLFAFDTSVDSISLSVATNMNVLVLEGDVGIEFDDYIEININQLKNIFDQEMTITTESVYLGQVESALLVYKTGLNDAYGQPQIVMFHQYLLNVEGSQIVLTFASLESVYNKLHSVFGAIAQSFELE